MARIGLKLWSTNIDSYLREAERLYAAGVYDYVELYCVPGCDTAQVWKATGIPCIVHAPHSAHGVNLASAGKAEFNRRVFSDVIRFADELSADVIIAHSGVLGSIDEVCRQLKAIGDWRMTIENKPFLPMDGADRLLAGSTPKEIGRILQETGCGFCLDIGHCIASANAHGADWREYFSAFMALSPKMFHLSDIDTASKVDQHLHFGTGNLPIGEILEKLPADAVISIETEKDSLMNLDDFERDARWLR